MNELRPRAWILLATVEGLLLEVSLSAHPDLGIAPWTATLHLQPTGLLSGELKGYEVARVWSDEAPCLSDDDDTSYGAPLYLGRSLFSVTGEDAARFSAWMADVQGMAEQAS
ncbi:hypothetical protein EA658_10005 [Pseudoxanthomonas winnipegensis]|uniref:Uncharacterized protein n=1 Tax=Pseudoxanthomonas winnipegensis TaxID=2480810 RepID=A0ABY1WCX8_9GAMM|nr:hypothetical protein [Pseudoxanthomonas winnipegensis]TAA12436.1 hypothetical protein EA659_03645 [Pseudoxanthomonas winnipegensis]TAA19199.1 hypothetical protein EA658_10005 [Pseudoxanthomonas winnipegensis]TAH70460.1 hypothetical protein EA657_17070 [Pseudoxanthomonas winnipegensis]